MLRVWRYDSKTNEVEVPRIYDAANGRASKIKACKTCREKKTRCTGAGQIPCDRCLRKQLSCEYAECAAKTRPRLKGSNQNCAVMESCSAAAGRHSSSSSIEPRTREYDSGDAWSDRTLSSEEDHMPDFELVDSLMGVDFAFEPLVWQAYSATRGAAGEKSRQDSGGASGHTSVDVDLTRLLDMNQEIDSMASSQQDFFPGADATNTAKTHVAGVVLDWAPLYT